ncbi:uncharacterized protein EDB91DRAFT_1181749 [Suillus paluster]|uniref:uncharacterized protein n=1 Tax=Suillus paluster TaxID=48578 RepID=UPI001B87BA24|nr:uncharacterized protein EDB91DRAFT_1181749 [Suillus paluster]KAG1719254.1 hypothetical protein EDB91DRAFT_1181749 [Suillus paluster]
MGPPKSKTTIRIGINLGPASQFANSPTTVIELKGRTDREKGEHYLQLSLSALKDLADLVEDGRLSAHEREKYNRDYLISRDRYDDLVGLRDRLLAQKKSFRRFLVNLFVRESDARRFYKVTYESYATIRRTSEGLVRRLLLDKNDISASGSPRGSAQGDVSVCEESPPDIVEGNMSVKDLPPNETLRGINVDVDNEQEEQEAFAILNRIARSGEADEDEDEDDDRTIKPSTPESRPTSPSPSLTVINNYNFYNQSVVSVDSEMTGTVVNCGGNGGIGSASRTDSDTNKPPSPWD